MSARGSQTPRQPGYDREAVIAVRRADQPVRPMACLAFVAILGVLFWVGVIFVAQRLLITGMHGL